jgi:hypothetical protein
MIIRTREKVKTLDGKKKKDIIFFFDTIDTILEGIYTSLKLKVKLTLGFDSLKRR